MAENKLVPRHYGHLVWNSFRPGKCAFISPYPQAEMQVYAMSIPEITDTINSATEETPFLKRARDDGVNRETLADLVKKNGPGHSTRKLINERLEVDLVQKKESSQYSRFTIEVSSKSDARKEGGQKQRVVIMTNPERLDTIQVEKTSSRHGTLRDRLNLWSNMEHNYLVMLEEESLIENTLERIHEIEAHYLDVHATAAQMKLHEMGKAPLAYDISPTQALDAVVRRYKEKDKIRDIELDMLRKGITTGYMDNLIKEGKAELSFLKEKREFYGLMKPTIMAIDYIMMRNGFTYEGPRFEKIPSKEPYKDHTFFSKSYKYTRGEERKEEKRILLLEELDLPLIQAKMPLNEKYGGKGNLALIPGMHNKYSYRDAATGKKMKNLIFYPHENTQIALEMLMKYDKLLKLENKDGIFSNKYKQYRSESIEPLLENPKTDGKIYANLFNKKIGKVRVTLVGGNVEPMMPYLETNSATVGNLKQNYTDFLLEKTRVFNLLNPHNELKARIREHNKPNPQGELL